jgi:hypothetical protein
MNIRLVAMRSIWTNLFQNPKLKRNLLPLSVSILSPFVNVIIVRYSDNLITWGTKMLFASRMAVVFSALCLINDGLLQWIGPQRIKQKIVLWYLFQMVVVMLLMLLFIRIIQPHNLPNLKIVSSHVFYYRMCVGCFIFLAFQYIGIFYTEHEREKIQSIQLERDRLQIQVELVRQQVNPHFLFNSLSILQMMIREKDKQAESYLLGMANVYKRALYFQDKDLIPFQEELDGLNLYLTMLRSRFSEGLMVTMDLSPVEVIAKYRIPAMGLQILVENCIKHNIATLESPLHIQITQKTPTCITVSNNLQRISYHQDSSNIGHQYLETQYQAAGIQNGMRKEVNAREYAVTLILL